MKLGIIGWYGHGNEGDETILDCLRKLFVGCELLVASSFDDAWNRRAEFNGCDYVLLGGGGLIVRGFNRYAPLFEQMRPPFSCVGLGVEARHADNQMLIDVLLDRAESIIVRDTASAERMGNHAKLRQAPDLTFLFPHDVADWTTADRCGFNLRPWPFWRAEFRGRHDNLMRRLSRRLPRLERWYPLAKWSAAGVAKAVAEAFDEVCPLPLHVDHRGGSDLQALAEHMPTAPSCFWPQALANCRYLISMRLHGLIFACQMGIPFVSLSYQPKNVAFCADLKLPELSVDLFDPAALPIAIESMRQRATEIRAKLLAAREQYHEDAWRAIEPLAAHIRNRGGSRRLNPPLTKTPRQPFTQGRSHAAHAKDPATGSPAAFQRGGDRAET